MRGKRFRFHSPDSDNQVHENLLAPRSMSTARLPSDDTHPPEAVELKSDGPAIQQGLRRRLTNPTAPPPVRNRWTMAVPVFVTHLSLGSPWGWSVVASMLLQEQGFVAPAACDWTLSEASLPLSIVFAFQGFGAAFLGKWQMKVGPRTSLYAASALFGGGIVLGSYGVATQSLPLLYLGYGVLAGSGIGVGYTPPIQTLMQWFPDKPGLGSAIAVTGFGSGALLFAPLVQRLRSIFMEYPTYVGPAHEITHYIRDGKYFTEYGGETVEVVLARSTDLAKYSYDLAEGLYIVGSGNTGTAGGLNFLRYQP